MSRFNARNRTCVPIATGTLILSVTLSPQVAQAQEAPPAGPVDTSGDATVTVVQAPAPAPTVVVPGFPQPGTNLESHLPSSAQAITDTTSSQDGFDLNVGPGAESIRGGEGGTFVAEGSFVPQAHTVRRGDTLWDVSARYYKSPYQWPRIWSYNPQISNPHWIYPGDRIRLKVPGAGGFGIGRPRTVPPETIFLRNIGWVDDPDEDATGELVGAADDQMLLSFGDDVYIQIDEDRNVQVGDELQVFRPLRTLGDSDEDDELVSIRGTVRVDRVNQKTKMARAKIIESLDVIERGALVGPIERRFEIVPPAPNEKDVEATILAAVYPYQFFGKEQVVFLDVGSEDGVKPGNRFFAIRRGDLWEEGLDTADSMARLRARVEDDRPARVDKTPLNGDPDDYPDETYAEIRVVSVREHSSMAIVTASIIEVERDAYLLARKGY
jgi:LysM repeat protein